MRLGILRRLMGNRSRYRRIWLSTAVSLLIGSVILLALRGKSAPLAVPICQSMVESKVNQLIGETAQEVLAGYASDELCALTYAPDGSVRSVWVNSKAVNRLAAELTGDLNRRLADLKVSCKIKSGDLFFPKWFSGSGISLTVRGSVYGGVSVEAMSDLTEGGLNQTLHRLALQVSAPLTVTVLGEESQLNITTRILIEETVIVGAIPGGVVVGE